jgi:hypothetical protein
MGKRAMQLKLKRTQVFRGEVNEPAGIGHFETDAMLATETFQAADNNAIGARIGQTGKASGEVEIQSWYMTPLRVNDYMRFKNS